MLEREQREIRTEPRQGRKDLHFDVDFREQEATGNDAGKLQRFVKSNQQAFVVTVTIEPERWIAGDVKVAKVVKQADACQQTIALRAEGARIGTLGS